MNTKANPSNQSSGFKSSVTNEVQNFLEDIEDLVKETTSLTGEELNRAKAKLSERVASAKESIEAMGSDLTKRARKGATVTNEYVHDQPWKAIGATAAVAFLIGFALSRRN